MKRFFTTPAITANAENGSNKPEGIVLPKQNLSRRRVSTNATIKISILGLLLFQCGNVVKAQQVTEVVTDFGGFWKSGVGALNATYPNTSHNLLSFTYNSVVYSTGADDNKLTTNGISYTPGDFRGFPIATIGGTI